MLFLLLFVGLPIVELMLLLRLGELLGFVGTLGLVLATGVLGATLAKHQGMGVLRRIQEQAATGRMPAGELVDGVLILVAAALLITPGVLTDATGFLLLLPPFRALLRTRVARYFSARMTVIDAFPSGGFGPGGHRGDGDGDGPSRGRVIDLDD